MVVSFSAEKPRSPGRSLQASLPVSLSLQSIKPKFLDCDPVEAAATTGTQVHGLMR